MLHEKKTTENGMESRAQMPTLLRRKRICKSQELNISGTISKLDPFHIRRDPIYLTDNETIQITEHKPTLKLNLITACLSWYKSQEVLVTHSMTL